VAKGFGQIRLANCLHVEEGGFAGDISTLLRVQVNPCLHRKTIARNNPTTLKKRE
jgi:hypothetical protein